MSLSAHFLYNPVPFPPCHGIALTPLSTPTSQGTHTIAPPPLYPKENPSPSPNTRLHNAWVDGSWGLENWVSETLKQLGGLGCYTDGKGDKHYNADRKLV